METNTRKKRTHLSTQQVSILEASFTENSHPDSSIRNQLANELSISGRTVQIWFQNKRAKEKKVKVRSSKPTTFRSMMTPEQFEPIMTRPRSISKPEPKTFQLVDIQQRALSEGLGQVSSLDSPAEIIQLRPNALRIGTWTRFSSEAGILEWDLSCDFIIAERAFCWKVRVGKSEFKIKIEFDQIHSIQLQPTGQLNISVCSLSFSMLIDQQWLPCADFTEDQQASISAVHSLEGDYELLKHALLDIMILAPELSAKIINPLDYRDYSVSPSATPEPFMIQQHTMNSKSDLMLQAPFPLSPIDSNYNSLYNAYII
ncbi:unnamed protein product [Rhizopus stolonifer]